MARYGWSLLAGALLLGLASGAYMPEQIDSLGLSTADALHPRLAHAHMRGHAASSAASNEEMQAIISTRYIVPPKVQDEFIERWKHVFDMTQQEGGCIMYDLSKTKIDNVVFSSYGEWNSWGDFNTHMAADYINEWMDFLSDKGVMFNWYSLRAPANDVRPGGPSTNKGEQGAFVLVRYLVPFAKHEEFVNTWQQVADDVRDKEQGKVMVYSLRRVETDNYSFFVYGSWDSQESYMEHFKSDHVQRLLDYDEENDIAWFLAPMRKYGRHDQ